MRNKTKASALATTLIILGIIMISALSLSLISIKERNSSIGEGKSDLAFQNAQTGVEFAMSAILKNQPLRVGQLPGFSCSVSDGNARLTPNASNLAGLFQVELKSSDSSGTNCGTPSREIVSIKSIGTGIGAQRAIEAAVASGVSGTMTGWCEEGSSAPGGYRCNSSDAIYPAQCSGGSCSCPTGYTKKTTGGCGWGTCSGVSNERYYSTCVRN